MAKRRPQRIKKDVEAGTSGYGGYHDHLHGEALKKNEVVQVSWPDGTTSEHKVDLEEWSNDASCHNDRWVQHHSKACILVTLLGAKAKIHLSDIKGIKVIRKKDL